MEQAKAADGYLPKWHSNHLPRQREERERGGNAVILQMALLQCSAATQQQTVVLQLTLLQPPCIQLFLTNHSQR